MRCVILGGSTSYEGDLIVHLICCDQTHRTLFFHDERILEQLNLTVQVANSDLETVEKTRREEIQLFTTLDPSSVIVGVPCTGFPIFRHQGCCDKAWEVVADRTAPLELVAELKTGEYLDQRVEMWVSVCAKQFG